MGNAIWRTPWNYLWGIMLKNLSIYTSAVITRRYKNVGMNQKSMDKLAKKSQPSFLTKILQGKYSPPNFLWILFTLVYLLLCLFWSNENWKPWREPSCCKPKYYLLFKNELFFVFTNIFGFQYHFLVLERRETNSINIRSSIALAFFLPEVNITKENTVFLWR